MTKATQAASLLAIAVIAWAVLMVAPLPSPLQEVVPVVCSPERHAITTIPLT